MNTENTLTVTTFNFDLTEVRVTIIDDETWFVAADVCAALGITTEQIRRLDDDERSLRLTQTSGGKKKMSIINESGLYSLTLGSRKPEAKRFKKWVTSEVLPLIRKTGKYEAPNSKINPDELTKLAKVARNAVAISRAMGFKGKDLYLNADSITEQSTGISPMKRFGFYPTQDVTPDVTPDVTSIEAIPVKPPKMYTPTELAVHLSKDLGKKCSAQEVNELLCECGLQVKDVEKGWALTSLGIRSGLGEYYSGVASSGRKYNGICWQLNVLSSNDEDEVNEVNLNSC